MYFSIPKEDCNPPNGTKLLLSCKCINMLKLIKMYWKLHQVIESSMRPKSYNKRHHCQYYIHCQQHKVLKSRRLQLCMIPTSPSNARQWIWTRRMRWRMLAWGQMFIYCHHAGDSFQRIVANLPSTPLMCISLTVTTSKTRGFFFEVANISVIWTWFQITMFS